MAKNGATQSTTTSTQLSPEQQKVYNFASPFISKFASGGGIQLPTGALSAGPNALQHQGQSEALAGANTQDQLAASGASSSDFLLNHALYANSNPYLGGYIDAATRPISQELTQSTLPKIRGDAANVGGFGGSRQGIAEGLASQGASQAIGDTTAKISSNAYSTGLQGMLQALNLLPQTQGAQTAGAVTRSGVGDVQQAEAQRVLDEANYRQMYKQLSPLYTAQELLSLGQAIPGGSVTSTGPAPYRNPITGALGGAGLGASIGSAVPGIGTAVGAGAGGLAGLLGSIF